MMGPQALLSVLQFYHSVLNFLAVANPNLALFQGSISAKLWQAAKVSASRLTLRLEAASMSVIGSLRVMVFALGVKLVRFFDSQQYYGSFDRHFPSHTISGQNAHPMPREGTTTMSNTG
jgi:hypothetical protein